MNKNKFIASIVFIVAATTQAQSLPNPTATPELIIIPDDFIPQTELRSFLVDAVDRVNSLPQDPAFAGNIQIIPNETATQLFGYTKWIFSFTTAQELLGTTLAPIGIALYMLLFVVVVGATIFFTIKLITLILRLAGYVSRWVMRLLLRGG